MHRAISPMLMRAGVFAASAVPIVNEALTLTNPGFETGDLTGWTTEAGSPAVVTGAGALSADMGTYCLSASTTATALVYQDIDVSAYSSQIDAGDGTFSCRYRYGSDNFDLTSVYISCLDGGASVVDAQTDVFY